MIKETLKEAGRYEEVMSILKNISLKSSLITYPVHPYAIKHGKICFRVDGSKLVKEAKDLIQAIEENDEEKLKLDNYLNLHHFVQSTSDDLLHNYAVHVSHKNTTPNIDMEKIRVWEILDNLIICLDYEDGSKWYIPDGWKKTRKEEEVEIKFAKEIVEKIRKK